MTAGNACVNGITRIYKDDDHFQPPEAARAAVLTAGPLTRDAAVELLRRTGPFLATNCPPAPPP